ncbi:hypothetical protein D3C80_2071660 [compost metagenome]
MPFMACGDLNGFDSDMNYALLDEEGEQKERIEPIQPPTNPPYKEALRLKHSNDEKMRLK